MDTWTHGTWTHGHMETWGHGDMETWTTTNSPPEECLDGGEKFEKFEKFEISRLELSRVFELFNFKSPRHARFWPKMGHFGVLR